MQVGVVLLRCARLVGLSAGARVVMSLGVRIMVGERESA